MSKGITEYGMVLSSMDFDNTTFYGFFFFAVGYTYWLVNYCSNYLICIFFFYLKGTSTFFVSETMLKQIFG